MWRVIAGFSGFCRNLALPELQPGWRRLLVIPKSCKTSLDFWLHCKWTLIFVPTGLMKRDKLYKSSKFTEVCYDLSQHVAIVSRSCFEGPNLDGTMFSSCNSVPRPNHRCKWICILSTAVICSIAPLFSRHLKLNKFSTVSTWAISFVTNTTQEIGRASCRERV